MKEPMARRKKDRLAVFNLDAATVANKHIIEQFHSAAHSLVADLPANVEREAMLMKLAEAQNYALLSLERAPKEKE